MNQFISITLSLSLYSVDLFYFYGVVKVIIISAGLFLLLFPWLCKLITPPTIPISLAVQYIYSSWYQVERKFIC